MGIIRKIMSFIGFGMKEIVLEREGNRLETYKVRKQKEGIIYYGEKSMPLDNVEILYGFNARYYLVGELEPQQLEQLEVSAQLFRNKFFKSLLKDRFTISEWLLFILTLCTLGFQYFNYMNFQKFFELVGAN